MPKGSDIYPAFLVNKYALPRDRDLGMLTIRMLFGDAMGFRSKLLISISNILFQSCYILVC